MDIINKLKEIILSEKELLKHYKLIGFFGSSQEKNDFEDIDIVTIGNDNKHKELQKIINDKFSKIGYNTIFFETIKKKPKNENNSILIHDLHYSSFENLYEKEWPDIINGIKDSLNIIYGSSDKIYKIKVIENDIYSPLLDWVKEIKSKNEFENFKDYIKKILPKIYKKHKDLKLKNVGSKIILFLEQDWSKAKENIEKLLRKSFNLT